MLVVWASFTVAVVHAKALRLANLTLSWQPPWTGGGLRPEIADIMSAEACTYYFNAHIHCSRIHFFCVARKPTQFIQHFERDCASELQFCEAFRFLPYACWYVAAQFPGHLEPPKWGWYTDRIDHIPPTACPQRPEEVEPSAVTDPTCAYFYEGKQFCKGVERVYPYVNEPLYQQSCLLQLVLCESFRYIPFECYYTSWFSNTVF